MKLKFEVYDIEYETPEVPNEKDIEGYGLPKEQQKFVRWRAPRDFDNLHETEQVNIVKYALDKRKNGHFYYNNGEINYITGLHWFYLTFWKIDTGYPEYRRSDRNYFFYWDYCVNDPYCIGMINMENRRGGKTSRATCMLYEYISRNPSAHGGIQSKTDRDAKGVFSKLVYSWKRLPYWLKPMDEGDSQPKTALRFSEPSKRSSKEQKKQYQVALDSFIDFEASNEEAYDGQRLDRYIGDEEGKTVNVNVFDRGMIVRECSVRGNKVIGKQLVTTTVEEMDKKGGKNFKLKWDASNRNDRDKNGFTKTGLYRYFKPAYDCLEGFIDEYGNPMIEEAKTYLMNRRENLSGALLSSEKRKYPFDEEECFGVITGAFWEEDVLDILKQSYLESVENEDIEYVKVVSYGGELLVNPVKKDDDVVKVLQRPKSGVRYAVGIDSIATDNQTGDEGGSRFALVIVKGFDMDEYAYTPVCSFSIRPNRMEDAYTIATNIIRWYGAEAGNKLLKVMGETNAGATNLLNHFINQGLKPFMALKPKSIGVHGSANPSQSDKFWLYRNDDVKEYQRLLANRFLRRHGHTIRTQSLVQSLLDCGMRNADEADAFMTALMLFQDFDSIAPEKKRASAQRWVSSWNPTTLQYDWTLV